MQVRISASTARELAEKNFNQGKLLESQAWLTQAILLDDAQAIEDFCIQGTIKKCDVNAVEKYFHLLSKTDNSLHTDERVERRECGPYTYAMLWTMLTAIILSGKKIPQFSKLFISGDLVSIQVLNQSYLSKKLFGKYDTRVTWIKGSNDAARISFAITTKYPADSLLNEDSRFFPVASFALNSSPLLFFGFMSYCVQNNILTTDNYQLILKFIEDQKPNETSLLNKGEKILQKLTSIQQQYEKPVMQPSSMLSTVSVLHALQPQLPVNQSTPPPFSSPDMSINRFNQQFPSVPKHVPSLSIHNNQSKETSTITTELQPVYLPKLGNKLNA